MATNSIVDEYNLKDPEVVMILEKMVIGFEKRIEWLETCNDAYQKHGLIKVVREER